MVDVKERFQAIGPEKCKGLIGFHNFSGADWGGKFIGLSKKSWAEAYLKLSKDDPVVKCFQELGQDNFVPEVLVNGELPPQVKSLKQFVCSMYNSVWPRTLPALRWELFRSKNLEGEMRPPTRSSFLPHLRRVNYVSLRDKSYTQTQFSLPPIKKNGLAVEGEVYIPVKSLSPPAPLAVLELIRCKACITGCTTNACSCTKNSLPCTPLCKCYGPGSQCSNPNRSINVESDDNE